MEWVQSPILLPGYLNCSIAIGKVPSGTTIKIASSNTTYQLKDRYRLTKDLIFQGKGLHGYICVSSPLEIHQSWQVPGGTHPRKAWVGDLRAKNLKLYLYKFAKKWVLFYILLARKLGLLYIIVTIAVVITVV